MPAREVEFHAEAVAETQAAILWYLERSESAAAKFVEEIRTGVRFITESPAMCAQIDRQHRHYGLRRFPYSLIFREKGETIQVIAVAHGRRRPGYWRKRK